MATVHSPNRDYNGVVAGVAFVDGQAEVDLDENPAARLYFETSGYVIDGEVHGETFVPTVDRNAVADLTFEGSDEDQRVDVAVPEEKAHKDAWVRFLEAHGVSTDGTKDELIARAKEHNLA